MKIAEGCRNVCEFVNHKAIVNERQYCSGLFKRTYTSHRCYSIHSFEIHRGVWLGAVQCTYVCNTKTVAQGVKLVSVNNLQQLCILISFAWIG